MHVTTTPARCRLWIVRSILSVGLWIVRFISSFCSREHLVPLPRINTDQLKAERYDREDPTKQPQMKKNLIRHGRVMVIRRIRPKKHPKNDPLCSPVLNTRPTQNRRLPTTRWMNHCHPGEACHPHPSLHNTRLQNVHCVHTENIPRPSWTQFSPVERP